MRYNKPPLTTAQQVDLLVQRGMSVPDRARAADYLAHISYYRLRAYWLPFEETGNPGGHRFRPGTAFDDALALYVFDRRLRLVVLDAIERVEVSVRTRFADVLGNRYGAHAHLEPSLFADADRYRRCLDALREEIARSQETFIEHYRRRYTDPELPPIWAACEVMSFGQLSKWIANLEARANRNRIARIYGLDERVLVSFLHHLTYVRNLCAHHCRLWNRRFTIEMRLPKTPRPLAAQFNPAQGRKLYNTLTMLGHLVGIVSPASAWRERVKALIADCPLARPEQMGFPQGWEEQPLWRGA